MTQIKLFYASDDLNATTETKVNKWLEENHEKIRVKDIKMQSYCTPSSSYRECDNIMVIYEDRPLLKADSRDDSSGRF